MKHIYRYQVPVDDKAHEFELRGDLLHVGCRAPREVEFWAFHDEDAPATKRFFVVVGTGHKVHPRWEHRGTVVVGPLVWHLMEMPT